MSNIHYIKKGTGPKLLLIHGLGGSSHSFDNIIDDLAKHREVVSIDLPGFGMSPPIQGKVTVASLADAIEDFLHYNAITGIDVVGSSLGGRLVLELVRRKAVGNAVAFDPGGFWKGWEKHAFFSSMKSSIVLLRSLKPLLSKLMHSPSGRATILAQLSAHPKKLSGFQTLQEVQSYVEARSFDELLHELAYGEKQKGMPINSLENSLVIAWGKKDRVCFPVQAKRAQKAFPDAKLYWLDDCGHFPHWDSPAQATRLILEGTGRHHFTFTGLTGT